MVMAPKVVTTVSTAEQQRAPVVHNELYSHVRPMLPQDEPIMDHWSAILICGGYNCNNLKYHNHESIVVFVGTKGMMKTYFVISEFNKWDDVMYENDEYVKQEINAYCAPR
jgi:hypothetical protein